MRTDALEKLARVVIAPDGLKATLQIQPGVDPEDLTPQAIEAVLASRGVRASFIDPQGVQRLLQLAAEQTDAPVQAVVAVGLPPRHGIDGRLELDPQLQQQAQSPDDDQDAPDAEPDDDDSASAGIDHYARSAFVIVQEGQRIGVVHPHSEAEDGMDVRGKVLKAVPGRPCPVRFDEASVEVTQDGTVLARRRGRLELTDTKLAIEPVLEIDDSVDFSTGNVSFPGDVLIRKGVKDCFTVEVGKDLEIVELVEAATIQAKGTIVLRRGMAGRGKGRLNAGGDLQARYLDGVQVVVGNDLMVQRELTNCITRVGRCVQAPSCTVTGGELWVRFGGRVRALGGEAEASTLVRIGVDARLESNAPLLDELIPQLLTRLNKARQELSDLQKATAKLTPTQAEAMTSLQFEVMTGQSRLPTIRESLEKLMQAFKQLHAATLTVERIIMPGVTVAIGPYAATVREAIRGPVTIALQPGGTLVLQSPTTGATTPLAAKAKLHRARDAVDPADLKRWLDNPSLTPTRRAA